MDPERLKNFQEFIYTLLFSFLKDAEKAKKYVDQAGMEKWIQAFTHELLNPSFNYESMETRGDYVLKSVFTMYLMKRFQNKLDPETINDMNQIYMSKQYQGQLAKRLGFEPWIRTAKVTISVLEDTFEAFVGALYEISETKDNMGRAYINVNNFIVWLFDKIAIDTSQVAAKKTFVDQTFARFGFEEPYLKPVRSKRGDYAYQLEINDQNALKFFSERGFNFDRILGVGYGKSQKEGKKKTYEDAFERMRSAGVTKEWAGKEKIQWDFQAQDLQPYLPKAKENLKKLAYQSMYFKVGLTTEKTTGKEIVISLVGVKDLTNEHIIIETAFAGNELEGKKFLLRRLSERTVGA